MKIYDKIEKSNLKINSALLVGGGTISHYLIGKLLENRINVKVIENNKERAEKLSEAYPKAIVIRGDEADQEFLMQERISNYDATAVLTDSDEENAVITMFVNSITNSKLITKKNRKFIINMIASILRNEKMIFPGGNDVIKSNDSVMIVITASSIEDFDDILE